jgi:hypothetical protein
VRQIQVVDMGGGTFCATVKNQGSFTTFPGISPGGTGVGQLASVEQRLRLLAPANVNMTVTQVPVC